MKRSFYILTAAVAEQEKAFKEAVDDLTAESWTSMPGRFAELLTIRGLC